MNNQFGYPQPVMPQNNMGYPMYNGLPINQPVYRTQVPQVQPMQMQPSYSVIPGRIVNTPDEIRPNEVPNDGSIAVFPLNDGSAVYLKYFTGEGRINTVKFTLETPETVTGDIPANQNEGYAAIKQQLDEIKKMIAKNNRYHRPYQKKEAVNNAGSDEQSSYQRNDE